MDAHDDPGLSNARKLYTFLILAYPSSHRAVYGTWMVQLFSDQYRTARDAAQSGWLARLWLGTLVDLIASALQEHMAELRRSMMGGDGSDSDSPDKRRDRITRRFLLGLALIFLVIGSLYSFPLMLGFRTGIQTVIILAILLITIYLLFKTRWMIAARSWRPRTWIFSGLLAMAALLAPTSILVRPQEAIRLPLADWIFTAISMAIFFIPCVALVLAALLIHAGVGRLREGQPVQVAGEYPKQSRQASWAAAALFSLSVLLVGRTIYNLYWLAIWDSTDDSLGNFWLMAPVFSTVLAGLLLAALLPWKVKAAGFCYALLISSLMIAVFYRAQQVDYRQLTEARAGQISQALEAYHARLGRYPQSLGMLTPRDLFTVPGPVIMVGQNHWCYQAGVDYYRLGYLDSNHWSSPIRFGRLISGKGRSPLTVDVCQPAIDAYRTRFPGWVKTLQGYGQPTPTPDIQEVMP